MTVPLTKLTSQEFELASKVAAPQPRKRKESTITGNGGWQMIITYPTHNASDAIMYNRDRPNFESNASSMGAARMKPKAYAMKSKDVTA